MQKNLLLILILAIIIGVFALSNSDVVEIDFVFTRIWLSQAIVIFISVLLGSAIATLFGWGRELKAKKSIKELTNRINILESDKNGLQKTVDTKEEQLKLLYSRIDGSSSSKQENDNLSSN